MNYCVDFYNHLTGYEKADEYTIKYTKKNDVLIDFLEKNNTKRVNLTIEARITEAEMELFVSIYEKFSNLVLRFESYDADIIDLIQKSGIPFFFGNRINNWDEFIGFVNLGVSDIYVVEDLCFDLERVASIAKPAGIRLRTFANVAQSTWKGTPEIKKFWIRPEDISIYEKYIDTLEFFGTPQQISVLLKVYKEDKQWFGRLKEIIFGLQSDIDSRFIIQRFAEQRVKCRKDCLKGGKCQVCDRVVELSNTLEKANIMIKPKRED
jgi:hypothetical protein